MVRDSLGAVWVGALAQPHDRCVKSRNSYTLSSVFFFGPSGPGDHTTGSTALNLGMLHACFDQQGAAAVSIVESELYTGRAYM